MSKFKMKKGSGTANADTPGSFSSLDTSTVQSLNNMAFGAGSQLQKAAFPEGGKGLTSSKSTKSFQFSGKGPSAFEYEQEQGAQRVFGKSASQLNNDEMVSNMLDVRGMGKVRGEGGVLSQKEKFEKQFGTGSSRMFKFANPKPTNTQVRQQGFDRAHKKQKQLSADMYAGAVETAKTMQKTGGSISTLKPKGIDMNLGYKPPMQAKTKQAKQKLLKNVAKATNKSKAPYSLASVAIQALKIPFTKRAYGAREGAKSELKRKAGLVTYGKMRLF
jgi:hypothetical protein